MDYRNYLILEETNIRLAMQKLDEVKTKIVFVTKNDKLLGTVTDGDIRRYLLNNGKLDDLVINAANKQPKVAYSYNEAVEIYNKTKYIAIPIVDLNFKLKDIYIPNNDDDKIFNPINIPVVINAGGKGTRLYPYTKILPKPLIPVGETPILELIMQDYIKYKCEEFHIIVNYKKELIKAYFSENENKYNINWYNEHTPLGTGGGLSLLKEKINSTFFFINCDTLIKANYDSIIRYHRQHNNVITMICAYKNLIVPYGIIDMGKDGSINAMKEKPEMSFLTNTGMYIVEPEVINDIQENQSIGFPDIVQEQIKKGKNISIYPISENEWLDMGQIPELEKMRNKLLED